MISPIANIPDSTRVIPGGQPPNSHHCSSIGHHEGAGGWANQ